MFSNGRDGTQYASAIICFTHIYTNESNDDDVLIANNELAVYHCGAIKYEISGAIKTVLYAYVQKD